MPVLVFILLFIGFTVEIFSDKKSKKDDDDKPTTVRYNLKQDPDSFKLTLELTSLEPRKSRKK